VLKVAPGNVDALCGAAQVRIELADDGDQDQYEIAVQYLTEALKHGKCKETGSKRLRKRDLANIYYARGYAQAKSCEADASWIKSLDAALNDFQKCKEMDPINSKARVAIEKINKRRSQRRSELLADVLGPIIIFCSSMVVLTIVQLMFILHRLESLHYISLTGASLVFMVAAICLPQLLKLKLPGVELEKASIGQVSAPSIGISRSESLIGQLKSLSW